MDEFYKAVPIFLPSWFVALLAFWAGAQCAGLSLYLMRTRDHLILHAADLGMIGCFSALVGVHYLMIYFNPGDIPRGVAISRITWSLFFGANIVIMARYIFAIVHKRPSVIV
jgi:hypothetical protein